jgi:hypothetical protein
MKSFLEQLHGQIQDATRCAERHEVKGATIFVAPDTAAMGKIAGLLTLTHMRANSHRKTRWDYARAPSQTAAWATMAQHWPRRYKANRVHMFPFDEIRGGEYAKLETTEMRSRIPVRDALPHKTEIIAGDCSRAHAIAEAEKMNRAMLTHCGDDWFSMALAGTSPNAGITEILSPEYSPGGYEVHLAFDRPGLPLVEKPFKAIPMSNAASNQQENEDVVTDSSSINSDWVVTMTAHHLVTSTDAIVFSIPDKRGINLWRILHDDPDQVPAALMQRHAGLGQQTDYDLPKVVFCTTNHSWLQYTAAANYFEEHGTVLGA